MVRIMGNTNAAEHYHSYRTPRPPAPHLSVVEPPRSPARITPTTRGTTDAGTTHRPRARGSLNTHDPIPPRSPPQPIHAGQARDRQAGIRQRARPQRMCDHSRSISHDNAPGPQTSRIPNQSCATWPTVRLKCCLVLEILINWHGG